MFLKSTDNMVWGFQQTFPEFQELLPYGTQLNNPDQYALATDYCKSECEHYYASIWGDGVKPRFYFEDVTEALLFKLKFGGR